MVEAAGTVGPGVTIAVPVYNGAARLGALFERLDRLESAPDLTWEIVIVDNNSTDGTAAIVQDQISRSRVPLTYVLESRQGAAWARLRAIAIARGDWIFFLDDDNWPEADWLRCAWGFVRDRPRLGAVGGKVLGAYGDATLPPDFHRVEGFWAVRSYGRFRDRAAPFNPAQLQLPPAAALMVRRSAWLACVPAQPALTGKVPGRLVQGDDYEPLLYLARSGWEIWFCPELVTWHQIGAARLALPYALELARGCGLATYYLRSLLTPRRDRGVLFWRIAIGNLVKVIQRRLTGRDRGWADRVELAFLWGCALSPFYARRHLPEAPDPP